MPGVRVLPARTSLAEVAVGLLARAAPVAAGRAGSPRAPPRRAGGRRSTCATSSGQDDGAPGAGGRRGGRAPPVPGRAARARARRCWPSGCPGCCRPWTHADAAGGDRRSTRSPGVLPRRRGLVAPAAVRGAAPHRLDGGARRRRHGLTRPGAVSRAHRGVLFLDEAPGVRAARARRAAAAARARRGDHRPGGGAVRYPAGSSSCSPPTRARAAPRFGKGADCTCSPRARRRYWAGCPGRCWTASDLQVTLRPPRAAADLPGGDEPARSRPGCWPRGRVQPERLAGTPWRDQRRGARAGAAPRASAGAGPRAGGATSTGRSSAAR